jgi:PAS domain S-box-containing protein
MDTYLRDFLKQVKTKADKQIDYFLFAYFFVGLLLSFYFNTWIISLLVGGSCLLSFYLSKKLLPGSDFYQYVLSTVMAIFTAQFIYQTHGMFEMYFTAFIGSTTLIIYRNWKLQIPLALVIVLHHALFGYLQSAGIANLHFTLFEYMDYQTFMQHTILAIVVFSVCGYWSYTFKISGENSIRKSFEIGKLEESNMQKDKFIELANDLKISYKKLQDVNKELDTVFNTVDEVLFSIDVTERKIIQISKACNPVYGYTQEEFMTDKLIWFKLLHPGDRAMVKNLLRKLKTGQTAFSRHRIVTKNEEIHWIEMKLIPTRTPQKKLVRVDGIANNITARVRLENKLTFERRTQQQQLTAAVIAAQENERSFLGEELHDNINPILATAKLYLDCAISDKNREEELVKESKGFITTAMNEIRKLSRSLVPPSLGEIRLTDALNDLVEHLKVVNKMKFITRWNNINEDELSDKLKLTIYRIMQEQINNVFKHADAERIFISLNQKENELELNIVDDGKGFDTNMKKKGVGLQNIISRTELCNGKVSIFSSPGRGCKLQVNFWIDKVMSPCRDSLRA